MRACVWRSYKTIPIGCCCCPCSMCQVVGQIMDEEGKQFCDLYASTTLVDRPGGATTIEVKLDPSMIEEVAQSPSQSPSPSQSQPQSPPQSLSQSQHDAATSSDHVAEGVCECICARLAHAGCVCGLVGGSATLLLCEPCSAGREAVRQNASTHGHSRSLLVGSHSRMGM